MSQNYSSYFLQIDFFFLFIAESESPLKLVAISSYALIYIQHGDIRAPMTVYIYGVTHIHQ